MISSLNLNNSLKNSFEKAKEYILARNDFLIITHHDADGICAGGLMAKTFLNLNKTFHVRFQKDPSPTVITNLLKEHPENNIILDMGSSNIDFKDKTAVVLDHHQYTAKPEGDVIFINTHYFDIDGTKEACASTLSYLLSIFIDENNKELYPFFLAGMIGDRQHMYGYKGLNKDIIKSLNLEKKLTIAVEGRTIEEALFTTIDPYFEGISGNKKEIDEILSNLKIHPEKSPLELTEKELTSLVSYLSIIYMQKNIIPKTIKNLVCEKIFLEKCSAEYLSNAINATGKRDKMGVALSYILGENNFEEMKESLKEFKKDIQDCLDDVDLSSLEHIQYLYISNRYLLGEVANIAMRYVLDQDKPTFTLYLTDKNVNISARALSHHIERGVDLAKAMKKSAEDVGGYGGGHNIAAGATIPKNKEKEFLEKVNQIISTQIK